MSDEMDGVPINYRTQLAAAVALALGKPVVSADALAVLLYDQWYAPPAAEPTVQTSPAELLAHLRAADAAGSRFEGGWTVVDPQMATQQIGPPMSPWQVAVARDGALLWVDPVDFIYTGAVGLRPPVGASVQVSQRRDSLYILPGWWTTLSPAWSEAARPMVRVYWSIQPAGVCALVEALTSLLDPALPYALKCPVDRARFHRPDAITLYLPISGWEAVSGILQAAAVRCGDVFRHSIPSFTLPLWKGAALAEDPETDSFGMSRCKILAEGMWPTISSQDARAITLGAESALRQYGLSMDTPYLNPGSKANYTW